MTLETAKVIFILATSAVFIAIGFAFVYMIIKEINDDRRR